MPFWDREPFPKIVNNEHFDFVDPGPLHSPIKSFKLRRTEKFALTLETVCGKEAVVSEFLRDDRVIGEPNQRAEIRSIGGLTVRLMGVIPETIRTRESYRRDIAELRETAHVFGIEAEFAKKSDAAFTIDWLENLRDYYHWPVVVMDEDDIAFKRAYGRGPNAVVLADKNGEHSSRSAALKLTVAGIEFQLTTNRPKEQTEQIRPGYILYRGTPDEETRRKIRTVLSFTLGMYLVYLGHSTYGADSQLQSFRAIRSYSMDMRAFDLHVLPPAWLGAKSHNVLDTAKVSRLASALYAHYDELDFGNLSWGYWHAMCAPLHIKAVHFGAIIEALQRNYLTGHTSEFSEKVIGNSVKWDAVVKAANTVLDDVDMTDDQKALLRGNIGRLNQIPRSIVTDRLLQRLGLVLSEDEMQAWKRRHDAAHGNPMTTGLERDVVRDSHLMRVIFNRMILRIVDGNDHYYDYAAQPSPTYQIRNLRDPVQQTGKA